MRFKNKDKDAVWVSLSQREVNKYPDFRLTNIIEEGGLQRTVAEGNYNLKVNGFPVALTVNLKKDEKGNHIVNGKANDYEYEILKDREIRKFDIYRIIIQNWNKVVEN